MGKAILISKFNRNIEWGEFYKQCRKLNISTVMLTIAEYNKQSWNVDYYETSYSLNRKECLNRGIKFVSYINANNAFHKIQAQTLYDIHEHIDPDAPVAIETSIAWENRDAHIDNRIIDMIKRLGHKHVIKLGSPINTETMIICKDQHVATPKDLAEVYYSVYENFYFP